MPNLITVKVDVRKLDKARFFEGKANAEGHRPLYADLVLIPKRETGQFGDTHLVVQSKKKEENIQMPILGNAIERGQQSQEGESRFQRANPKPAPAAQEDLDEDVPF